MEKELLIKALRCDGTCRDECPYSNGREWCDEDRMIRDAADALEAAEQRIAEQQEQIAKLYILLNNRINEIAKLEAQLPKEGEWEQHIFDGIMGQRPKAWVCTMCNCLNVYKTDYCPNCGAKMKGEHDGES